MAPYHIVWVQSSAAQDLPVCSFLPQLLQISRILCVVRFFAQNLERLEYWMLMDVSQFSPPFTPNLKSAIGISRTYKLPIYVSRGRSTASCERQIMTILYITYVQDFTGSRIIALMGKSALTHCSCISRLKIWKRSCFLKFRLAWLTAQFCRLGRFSITIFLWS